jgi:hypothetical protein
VIAFRFTDTVGATMNLTVGPLPPAVYWRRRALVAGALLVLVLLVLYACGGSDGSNAAGQQPTGSSTSSPSPDPSPSVLSPIIGAGPASGSPSSTSSAATGGAPGGGAPVAADFCTDDDMQLTPVIRKITGGTYQYEITLTIKNISNRSCKRDVGADPQELHIVLNNQTVWSSDNCQDAHGQPDVRTFGPGIESRFTRGWDGTVGQACTNATAAAAGTYQLVAKLDTKVSAPVTFTIPGK